MIVALGAVGLAVALYFGGTRFLVGHHYFTKYESGDCLLDNGTKTIFLVRGNAKDSYLCEVKSSGNTIPGSFQIGASFALPIDAIDKSNDYSKINCSY